jgi:hypothetical protein
MVGRTRRRPAPIPLPSVSTFHHHHLVTLIKHAVHKIQGQLLFRQSEAGECCLIEGTVGWSVAAAMQNHREWKEAWSRHFPSSATHPRLVGVCRNVSLEENKIAVYLVVSTV